MLKFITAGESHGPACLAIVEGMVAGLPLTADDINTELAKRRHDYGRGGRGALEPDEVEILSGVRYAKTLGSPIALMVRNRDFANWTEVMSAAQVTPEAPPVTRPRPGHADLAGALKYGHTDVRNVLERASARETVSRVAAGAVARRFLLEFGIRLASHTRQIGSAACDQPAADFAEIEGVYAKDPETRCLCPETGAKMRELIDQARQRGDTLGGVIEVVVHGAPPGLGSVMQSDRRLDAELSGALMSIPSVKAVAIGDGIQAAATPGSEFVDQIFPGEGGLLRRSNHAGGIEGGMSNGEDIVCRLYLKPIATLGKPAASVDLASGRAAEAASERSDVCVVPRAGTVAEAMAACVLGRAMLEKFGGDSLPQTLAGYHAYLKELRERGV
jgi:chorismate synthase